MSNPFEEAAFETSIYHYFLFKANQAATAAAREATLKRVNLIANNTTTPLLALAAAASNDKDDGNKKPAAKPSGNDKNEWSKTPATKPSDKEKGDESEKSPAKPAGNKEKEGGSEKPSDADKASEQEPATNSPSTNPPVPDSESVASIMSAKYNGMAEAMKKNFPQYASKVPSNAPWIAPDVSMRYTHFPQVHNEAGFLRQRVFMLDQQLRQAQRENHQLIQTLSLKNPPPEPRKRGRPSKNPPADLAIAAEDDPSRPTKRVMTDKSYVYKRITNRPDVPDDVKKVVAKLKKEASTEKRNMKKKIARLEKKVSESKEMLSAVAKAPPPPPPQKLPPTPAPHKPAAAAAAAVMPPTKPAPPPEPAGPPPCFESRFKELVDYNRANNTCRVPGRVPGLGRWVSEIRKLYKISKERPEILEPRPSGSAADLTQERIDRLKALGFEFDVAPKVVPWEERFKEIMEYKEKHGTTSVPRNWKENPSLGEWYVLQHYYNYVLCFRVDQTHVL